MTTIEFSFIPDTETEYQMIVRLMSAFKGETGIEVKLKRMEWDDAWPQLIGIATQGQGVDISHVGSTWVSSLITMNALRPVPSYLINKMGGEQAFVHPTWSSVIAEGDHSAYGVPFSAYVYVVAYRKDLLQQAEVNSPTAFATPQTLAETVQRLDGLNATEAVWLMPVVPHPFSDLVHMAASWIWSSGGQIMDNRGKQVLFNTPAALAGLKSFFDLMRRIPHVNYLGTDDCMQALINGKAAAVVTDAACLLACIQNKSPNIENIGAASLMSIPWSGGGSIVIWRHTYGYPDRLEAAYKLTEFLARKHSMLELAQNSCTLPARTDALDELLPPEHVLRPVMLQLISTGRSYRTIALWHRIEHQLGVELGAIADQLFQDPNTDLERLVKETMDSLAHRLNLTLE
jgi:ABC-type glycerol-3-phosphate transport system substrate-binding protein